MSDDAIRVSGPINAAGLEMTLETGKLAQPRATAQSWSKSATPPVVDRSRRASPVRASTSSRSRSTSRSGCTPRARSRARSSGVKAGRASRRSSPPSHRPPAAAVVPRRLPQRGPGHRDDPRRRPREPARRRVDQRRVGRAHRLAASRSTVRSVPCGSRTTTASGSRTRRSKRATTSTFEIVVAGRRARRRRRRDHDGRSRRYRSARGSSTKRARPKVTEEIIAEGLEESKRWIKASIDLQLQLRDDVREGTGPDRADRVPARRSTTRPRCTTR